MNQKLIIDLEDHGLIFKMNLKNLGISDEKKYHESGARSDLDFVYTESASQVMLIYEADTQKFLIRLMQLPDIKFFSHLTLFTNREFMTYFVNAFREFAIGIMFQVHRYIGHRTDVDYHLEAIADNYMIVYQGRVN